MDRRILLPLLALGLLASCEPKVASYPDQVRVAANEEKGFFWDYLYRLCGDPGSAKTMVVIPNNSGFDSDEYDDHIEEARKDLDYFSGLLIDENIILIMPVFPKRDDEWWIYRNSLERNMMITDVPSIQREDMQLINMMNDLRLSRKDIAIAEKIVIAGYSSSGTFAHRFAFIHPEMVSKAVIGAPGGYLMCPIETLNGKRMTYPLGVYDYEEILGTKFDCAKLGGVEFVLYVGDGDKDDATKYRDSYTYEDELIIKRNFGAEPMRRWPKIAEIYRERGLSLRWIILPDTGHEINGKAEELLVSEIGPLVGSP